MIANDQERDALMAAVERYGYALGNAIAEFDRNGPNEAHHGSLARSEIELAAIRAMLAPDDAVVIPRVLAEAAAENLEMSANEFRLVDMTDAANERQADAEALRAVLRGEATR